MELLFSNQQNCWMCGQWAAGWLGKCMCADKYDSGKFGGNFSFLCFMEMCMMCS